MSNLNGVTPLDSNLGTVQVTNSTPQTAETVAVPTNTNGGDGNSGESGNTAAIIQSLLGTGGLGSLLGGVGTMMAGIDGTMPSTNITNVYQGEQQATDNKNNNSGLLIGLAVAGIMVFGGIIFMVTRSKKK